MCRWTNYVYDTHIRRAINPVFIGFFFLLILITFSWNNPLLYIILLDFGSFVLVFIFSWNRLQLTPNGFHAVPSKSYSRSHYTYKAITDRKPTYTASVKNDNFSTSVDRFRFDRWSRSGKCHSIVSGLALMCSELTSHTQDYDS